MTCALLNLHFIEEDTGTQKGKPTGSKKKAGASAKTADSECLTLLSQQAEHWPQELALPRAYGLSQENGEPEPS